MTQLNKIYQYDSNSAQSKEKNQFEAVEKIVDDIVKKGIPQNLSLGEFISRVSDTYGINAKEAKTCIRLAMNELSQEEESESEETSILNGECGYYYPSGYNTTSSPRAKNDGMDSLSYLGSYNKLMFFK